MALIIGLTGSIASGKSTVSLMFDDFSIPVVDADKISRDVVKPGTQAYEEIISTFGSVILRTDKNIDRKKLGEIVFSNKEKRQQLNKIVHPRVREEMVRRRDAYIYNGAKCVVLDIPLLFESNLTSYVDKTIVVYVDEEIQLQRLMGRDGFSHLEAEQRIRSQLPLMEKAKLADAVINNNGTKYQTYTQLEALLHTWNVL